MASRHDIPEHQAGTNKFEGVDDKETDAKAIEWFNKNFKYNKNYSWDWLHLLRIDQEEEITLIAHDDHP
ncbi:hypothetical protein A3C73_03850 [Candidatus Giovannonibacteria bacterium RIFCSPHIGHO2_02_FULL_44_11]|nr:MAG: hypothetical protein A3C73_03850 [Candidatus Giovannonibacteria bacterium RIFCSPHIGHO2_02_FULL_44_11]